MSKTVILRAVGRPVAPIDQDLINGLKALLQLAEDGGIQGIAYATIKTNGSGQYELCGTGWRGSGVDQNVHTVIGAVSILQARLLREKDCY